MFRATVKVCKMRTHLHTLTPLQHILMQLHFGLSQGCVAYRQTYTWAFLYTKLCKLVYPWEIASEIQSIKETYTWAFLYQALLAYQFLVLVLSHRISHCG